MPFASHARPGSWAAVQKLIQVLAGAGFIEPSHIQCPSGRRNRRQSPPSELSLQLLDPDAPPRHDFPVVVRVVGASTPIALGRCKSDAGGGAAVEADENDLV